MRNTGGILFDYLLGFGGCEVIKINRKEWECQKNIVSYMKKCHL